MARSRHKHVLRPRRRLTRIGLAASAVLAVGAPAAAIIWQDEEPDASPVARTATERARTSAVSMRVATPAGAEDLVELVASPEATPDRRGKTLDARTRPSGKARPVDGAGSPAPVELTGRTKGEWAEVVVGGKRVWVRKAAIAQTVVPESTPAETRTKRNTGTDNEAPRVLDVTTTTVKAVSTAQPTAGTSPSAAPAPATTSESASQPPVATSTPTPVIEEPAPEPTPVEETAIPAPTVPTETCDVTTNGQAVGLRRQLCELP